MYESIKENIIQQCQRYNTECEIQVYFFNVVGEKLHWTEDKWPFCGHAGVYLVINSHNDVIYIGEAKEIGNRLSDHFVGDADNCVVSKDNWLNPACVIVVKMPDDRKAFRKTLEEELYYIYYPTGKLYNIKM